MSVYFHFTGAAKICPRPFPFPRASILWMEAILGERARKDIKKRPNAAYTHSHWVAIACFEIPAAQLGPMGLHRGPLAAGPFAGFFLLFRLRQGVQKAALDVGPGQFLQEHFVAQL